jgi:hypothetical protein
MLCRSSNLTAIRACLACCATLSLMMLFVFGCRKSDGSVPVHGHIAYRGKPITKGAITFFPEKGRPIAAPIPEGDYKIDLTPGEYTVVVTAGNELPPGFKEGDPAPVPKIVLPDEYTLRAKSSLKASVKPGQSEAVDFDLKK